MKLGPKFKIARRLGSPIFEKTQTQKYQLSLSKKEESGKRFRRARSEYARQHNEKQKVRLTYGVTEKQFHNYVNKALGVKSEVGKPAELYQLLESRLDNAIYRLGLAPTRRAARQIVSHGHITVNDRKVNVPSLTLYEGDILGIRKGSETAGVFSGLVEKLKDRTIPSWLSFSLETRVGKVSGKPAFDQTSLELDFPSVFEFYSR
ncbi:MAG: 30S ribosomal protein S4 [Patescibacteria group bacterium]